MNTKDEPVIVSQLLDFSEKRVWKAITDVDEMRQWFFGNIPEFIPQAGFETKFPVYLDDRTFVHVWKLTEVIPYRIVMYNWKYEGYRGDSYVTFELNPRGKSLTELVLTHKTTEDFPSDIPEFTRDSCQEGWNYFIKNSLKQYLEKKNATG